MEKYLLSRQDVQKILANALVEQKIKLDPEKLDQLLVSFLELQCDVDFSKLPITSQLDKLAREFILSFTAHKIMNFGD